MLAGVVEFGSRGDGAYVAVSRRADDVVREDAAENEEVFEAFDAVLFELGDEDGGAGEGEGGFALFALFP